MRLQLATDGYLQDVPYPPQFHREMMPAWLDAVTRGLGEAGPNLSQPFRWCELGCGAGLNALVTAAVHPLAEVVAIDADATQITRLQRDAETIGLGNLQAIHADFVSIAEEHVGKPFDVIVMHGVLSWISPAARQAVLRFIARRLRPGGLVYAHYMTHPGLSAAAAAQRLVRQAATQVADSSIEGAQSGLALLSQMEKAGAGLFVAAPQERQRLAAARGQSPASLAHELLPTHWEPFHVSDMIEAFQAVGCRYIGSATPIDNIDAVSLPAAIHSLMSQARGAAMAETMRDIARNQSYRRDLYRMGGKPLSSPAHLSALAAQVIAALPGAPNGGGLTFQTPIGPVEGEAALFGPLLKALANSPQNLASLVQATAVPMHPALLNQATQMLIWAQLAHPVLTNPPPVKDIAALNCLLAAYDAKYFVVPALGTALPSSNAESSL